ncbi:MAG: RluA family pseudouridine synthase [Clostridia bacterium]|nr:RluA family pseudouridine synthase [Clostridia bacterium]
MNNLNEDKISILVEDEFEDKRLDAYLADSLVFSRSKIKKMIEDGVVFVNGKKVKPSYSVDNGDEIILQIPNPLECEILPEDNVPFEIVYEDDDIAVINKPQGVIVHPTSTIRTGTLVNGLLAKLDNLSGINGILRPGIVHRIDKDTSGLLVVAKNDIAHNSLAKQIEQKLAKRSYLAVVEGIVKEDKGRVETDIGRDPKDRKKMAVVSFGKLAITDYLVEKRFKENTLVRFNLQTGRTHQIRVHSKHIGHPIVGDKTYGFAKQKFKLEGQLLHAEKLVLTHPKTNEIMEFHAPLPKYFNDVLDVLTKTTK